MPPRRRIKPQISATEVRALLKKTDEVCDQSAKAREEARGGLILHFQQETDMLPVPEDQERRARMARKQR